MPTKSKGPDPYIEQPKSQVEIQNEDNAIHLKGKEPILTKYVRIHIHLIKVFEINQKVL